MVGDKWSRKYKKCRECGIISKPHYQHGYCITCWNAVARKKYKKYYQLYYKRYWKKNKDIIKAKRLEKVLCQQQANTQSQLKENHLP